MGYFITGATGFIGRHVVAELVGRGARVWVLVRPGSEAKFERLVRESGPRGDRLVAVRGELGAPLLGVTCAQRRAMTGHLTHVFHLGALYDLSATDEDLVEANVRGTANAIAFAHETRAAHFHFMSSIAAAGRHRGTFTEAMFEEAVGLDLPYFRTKHESEGLVRSSCRVPWRIYRPGMVVGHSRSGVIDKVDGPYYAFEAIRRLRDVLPPWMPLPRFRGGHVNLVPVDFVAAALVHLAHLPGQDGRCFHLTDPVDRRVGDVLDTFARAAHAPSMSLRLDGNLAAGLLPLPRDLWKTAGPTAQRIASELCASLGIPKALTGLLNHPTTFDAAAAQALLAPAGIRVPPLEEYAWRLWDYWDRVACPVAGPAERLRRALHGKTVVITGASSGIGRAAALQLAEAGAHVHLVARNAERLTGVRREIEAAGGRATDHLCDLADPTACDALIARLAAAPVDILVNNAGRSIRRPVEETYGRFHDYERLMSINYFAAVRMTLGLLPGMVRRGAGHVVNISSIGVLTNAPRFAAYNASKAALEAFSRCAAAEYAARGVLFSVINMPLVRTPMVAPTKIYEHFQLMEPERAAALIGAAIVGRPACISSPLGKLAQFVELFAPAVGRMIMSQAFQWFSDAERLAAEGAPGGRAPGERELASLAALAHDIGW